MSCGCFLRIVTVSLLRIPSLRVSQKVDFEIFIPLAYKNVKLLAIPLTREDEDSVFYRASDLILHEFEKMCGEFVSIGLVKITFPVEEIYTIELDR